MQRPLPVVDEDTAPFWNAARERRLVIKHCPACDRNSFYPRELCPYCHSDGLGWVESRGTGSIYSFTVARRPAGPAFADKVPYVLVLVDLDEGPRMLSNLLVDDVSAVRVGQRVRVAYEEVSDEISLPMFEPVTEDTDD